MPDNILSSHWAAQIRLLRKRVLGFILFCTISLLHLSTCLGQKVDQKRDGRDPMANGLKNISKEKILYKRQFGYISANFTYSRDFGLSLNDPFVQRTASYSVPLLYGRRITPNLAFELGPYFGLNRSSFVTTSLFKESVNPQATNAFSYGLLFGVSRRVTDLLSFDLRYRRTLNRTFDAWQPLQIGWSLRF